MLNKINVNLNDLSLNLVNLVGSADALQGGGVGGTTPTPYWRSLVNRYKKINPLRIFHLNFRPPHCRPPILEIKIFSSLGHYT